MGIVQKNFDAKTQNIIGNWIIFTHSLLAVPLENYKIQATVGKLYLLAGLRTRTRKNLELFAELETQKSKKFRVRQKVRGSFEFEFAALLFFAELETPAPINSRLNVVVRSPTLFGLGRNGCWFSRGSQLPRALPIHFFAMLPPERPQKGSTQHL